MKVYFIIMALISTGFFGVRHVYAYPMRQYFSALMYFSVAGILFAGFVLHNALLFVLVSAIILMTTVKSRIDALCRLAMLVALIPDIGQPLRIGTLYLGTFTTSETLSAGALLTCLFRRKISRRRGLSIEDALVFVLVIVFSIAAHRAADLAGISREAVTIALSLGLPYFIFSRLIRDRDEFGYVVGALAGASLILAVVALFEAKFHWSVYYPVFVNQSSGQVMSHSLRIRAGLMRAPTSFGESTSFALFQVIGVFAVIASRRLFKDVFLWSCSIGLAILGLMVAQSRGADLALFFGFFALLASRRRYALAAIVAAGGGAILAVLLQLSSSVPKIAQFIGADTSFASDHDYRQALLRRGIEEGMRHPFFGDDSAHVLARMQDMVQGEGIVDFVNTYLVIFLNSGFVGVISVLILLILVILKAWNPLSHEKTELYYVSLQTFIIGGLSAEALALLFTSFYERNPYWLMIMIAGCRVLQVKGQTSRMRIGQFSVVDSNSGDYPDPMSVSYGQITDPA